MFGFAFLHLKGLECTALMYSNFCFYLWIYYLLRYFLIRDSLPYILLSNNKKAKKYDVYNHITYSFAANKQVLSYHCPPHFIGIFPGKMI